MHAGHRGACLRVSSGVGGSLAHGLNSTLRCASLSARVMPNIPCSIHSRARGKRMLMRTVRMRAATEGGLVVVFRSRRWVFTGGSRIRMPALVVEARLQTLMVVGWHLGRSWARLRFRLAPQELARAKRCLL